MHSTTPEPRRTAQQLYAVASQLAFAERERYLDEQCPDPALRAEVERMLETTAEVGTSTADAPKPLERGSRLGSYEIQSKLGAGGMGWVYRATDLRLNRLAAVKVLPRGEIPTDAARRRFVREAEAASALNHPNIVTVYEIGRQDDIDFIAMELVQGRTLHDLIGGNGLGLTDTLHYAAQIADALAAAHEAGVVHRDLKPGNIMVTERGLVKVLDFGLAKRTFENGGLTGASGAVTMVGQIVGTASYMSPEQVEGREVDARSDIFSFGCLLYEMLTGRIAFAEGSSVGTMAAVLAKEPAPMRQSVPDLPRGFERIVAKCLQKRPSDRWQHIGDVKALLDELIRDVESAEAGSSFADRAAPVLLRPGRRFFWRGLLAGAAAGAVLGGGLAWFAWNRWNVPEAQPELRMVTADPGLSAFPALSRDGALLAFASDRGGEGNLDIWLQQTGAREPIRLTRDPADESDPSISPDGTKIAYRSEREGGGVYVIPALGGEPLLIAPGGRNPRFSPDGRFIAYWMGRESGYLPGASHVFVVEAGGGQPRRVSAELAVGLYPVWSPAGDELLVLGRGTGPGTLDEELDWWMLPAAGGPARKTGALAAFRTLRLAPLSGQIRIMPLEWMESGQRVVFAARTGDAGNLWEIGLRSRRIEPKSIRRVTTGPGQQAQASASGERIAFADVILNFDIWSVPLDPERGAVRGPLSRITDMGTVEWASSLGRGARSLGFISRKVGDWWVRLRDLETGKDRTLVMSDRPLANARVAGDGSRVLYADAAGNIFSIPTGGGAVQRLCEKCGTVMGVSDDGNRALYEPLESEDLTMLDALTGKQTQLALRPDKETILSGGQFSPDGKWVAFHSISNRDGTARVWLTPVNTSKPVPAAEWIPITAGRSVERDPAWSPTGSMLYYLSERDGFRCIWAQKLDSSTRRPSGQPFAVSHFHSARRSLARVGTQGYLTGLSIARDRMVFSLGELTGNIWMEEFRPR